jgi:hypothetical protein
VVGVEHVGGGRSDRALLRRMLSPSGMNAQPFSPASRCASASL